MPSVNRISEEFKGQGLEIVLVDFRENAGLVKRTVQERGYTARVLLDESGDVTGRVYGVWGPPTFYIVTRDGKLLGRAVGPHEWEGEPARKLIQSLLQRPPAR